MKEDIKNGEILELLLLLKSVTMRVKKYTVVMKAMVGVNSDESAEDTSSSDDSELDISLAKAL